MRIVNILKFYRALHMLCNSMAKNILLHGRKAVREEGDKFHHEICCEPKCSTLKGFMDKVDCNALMLLSNFHMDCLHDLALGLGRRGH